MKKYSLNIFEHGKKKIERNFIQPDTFESWL